MIARTLLASALAMPEAILLYLPAPLLRPGPLGLLWWQWLGLALLALIAWALALPLARLSVVVLTRLSAHTSITWDDALVSRLPGPFRLGWWLALVSLGRPFLDLSPQAQRTVDTGLSSLAVLVAFWALLRAADVLLAVVAASAWARANPVSRSLLPLALRSSKVAILALALVAVLSVWGFPVASLLAGLGIGGLAFALAAQKTVENLFGSFSIGVDQPFREGDFVKFEDVMGTVEAIGLRSTRLRTLDRTIITVPNGRLADLRVESFAPRDRMRLATNVTLVHGTTSAQVREVLAGLEAALRAQPKLWPEGVTVRFKDITSASLDIEVSAWFDTPDWAEFQRIREQVLLAFMEVVEKAGTRIASPTQTLRFERRAPRRAAGGAAAARVTRRAYELFFALGLVWGIPYLLIKVAVREVSPVHLVFLRTALGAGLLLPFALRRGRFRELLPRWRAIALFSAVELAGPWYLLSDAERRISSGLAGLLVASVPMVGALLSRLTGGDERLGRRGTAGLLLGLAGVAALVGLDVHTGDLFAVAEVALCVVGYAAGPLIAARRLSGLPGLELTAASLGLCALAYAPFALATWPATLPSLPALASVAGAGGGVHRARLPALLRAHRGGGAGAGRRGRLPQPCGGGGGRGGGAGRAIHRGYRRRLRPHPGRLVARHTAPAAPGALWGGALS